MASLRSSISAIELIILEGDKSGVNLESSFLCSVFLSVGKGRIGREMFEVSLEEILDLLLHIEKLFSQSEDEFEWSSVDGTVQLLNVFRESTNLRVEISITLQGTDGASMQFDSSDANLKEFGEEIRTELVKLLGGNAVELDSLLVSLDNKVKTIRRERRSPYSKKEN
ncbi:MAG: hypothetical protein ACYC7D_01350 [Nitrososphaerales archaeon]